MTQFRKEQIGEVIERLYDSEINARIDWFWDAGFSIGIGDNMNGWIAFDPILPDGIKINRHDISQAITLLAWNVRHAYPESDFSRWYDGIGLIIETEKAQNTTEFTFFEAKS